MQIRCPKTTQANHLCGMSVFVYWWLRQPGLQRITAWYTRLPRKAISLTSHAGLFSVFVLFAMRESKTLYAGRYHNNFLSIVTWVARSNAFIQRAHRYVPGMNLTDNISRLALSRIFLCFFQTGRLRFAFLGCTHPHKWT